IPRSDTPRVITLMIRRRGQQEAGEAGRSPSVTLSVVWLEPRTRPKGTVSPGLCSWSTPPSVSPLLRSVPSIFSTTSLGLRPARIARIDGGVGLDHIGQVLARGPAAGAHAGEGAVHGRDHTDRDRAEPLSALGAADGCHGLPRLDLGRVAELRQGQVAVRKL